MPSLNNQQIIGHLGSDPDMRITPNGKAVCSFNVACNSWYTKSDGERIQDTDWFTVIVWNKTAERCNQSLHKGSVVYAQGNTKLHKWESQDGQPKSRLELRAIRVVFLDKIQQVYAPEEEYNSEVPF